MYQTSEKSTVRIAEFSAQWEGRTVDGSFPLRKLLASGETSAVFLTTYDAGPAAIKLVSAESNLESADAQLARWRVAAKLSHPNLMRILSTGRCELDDMALLYIVMEYAEENLSQVLPDRSLTAAETREMLEPTLGALAYVHGQGFVHAHLKPANIMAVSDRLKISSDGLCRIGVSDGRAASPYDPPEHATGGVSPAGDVWSLGMTLVEVLTQHLPAGGIVPRDLPEPFAGIARGCLERNAADRWTVQKISEHLTASATPVPPLPSRRRRYLAPSGVLILLVLLVVIVVGVIIQHSETGAPPPAPAVSAIATPAPPPPAEPEPKPVAKKAAPVTKAPEPKSEPAPVTAPDPASTVPASGIAAQPLPEITEQAKSTIHGRVRLTVRVEVDPSGAVRDAKLDSPSTSKYFGERALVAARQWKFEPIVVNGSEVGQRWRLRFEFLKTGTKVQPQRVSP
jgi:TonB family protein